VRMQNRCAVQGLARFRHSAFRVRRCRDFTGAPLQTTSPSLGLVQPEQAISRAERTLLACAGAARKGGAPPPAPPHRDDARRCASVLLRYQGMQRLPCKSALKVPERASCRARVCILHFSSAHLQGRWDLGFPRVLWLKQQSRSGPLSSARVPQARLPRPQAE
jgi:hypothetical protein